MPDYRRVYIPGGTFFFTVVTFERRPIFIDSPALQALQLAIEKTKQSHTFEMIAICILPDHLHCIWTLPENDLDYSIRWQSIKSFFSHDYLKNQPNHGKISRSRVDKGEQAIWQRRFWEHLIRDEEDLIRHLDYIHYNPVKHGLVKNVMDWRWSSFHRFVADGYYPRDWGQGDIRSEGIEFQE